MLTSFFGKSTPLNFLLVSGYVFTVSFFNFLKGYDGTIGSVEILLVSLAIIGVILTMFLVEFTNRKNTLTQVNSFAILLYGAIASLFPSWGDHLEIVFANLFLLFAIRRIFSLQSSKNIEQKILDATLWIALASYFYFWSIWMLLILFLAIFMNPKKSRKLYAIPIIGLLGSALLFIAFLLIVKDNFSGYHAQMFTVSWNFTAYNSMYNLVSSTFFLAVLIWALSYRFSALASIQKKQKANHVLVIYTLIISMIIAICAHRKETTEFLFIAPMSALIIANYIEKKTDIWFKEILLWLLVLLPITRIML